MNRRRRRKIALIIVLTLLLAVVGALYYNFILNKTVSLNFAPPTAESLTPPNYLFSFSGGGAKAQLVTPTGVLFDAANQTLYVTDPGSHLVFQFDQSGKMLNTFGKGILNTPLYLARNPLTGNIYVSDRSRKSIFIFGPGGNYVGKFDPNLPKNQLPPFKTNGVQWEPVVFDFSPDGSLYVMEILNGHRLLIFNPQGTFIKSVGHAGAPKNGPTSAPMFFQFPNGLAVHDNQVFVADSNNQRVQVFDLKGNFKTIYGTSGLPRGMAFLNKWGPVKDDKKFVIVDPLSQMATIYGADGKSLATFGEQGQGDGQFSFPSAVAVSSSDKIFVTDTQNSRVEVWGWPQATIPISIAAIQQNWPWCLTPLLLLLALPFRRKRKFVASRDFVTAMLDAGSVDQMPASRRKWLVMPEDYEFFKDQSQGAIQLSELLEATEHSESDARAIAEKFETTPEVSALMSLAPRAYAFCTEDPELRRMAKMLDADVLSMPEFLERFSKAQGGADAE